MRANLKIIRCMAMGFSPMLMAKFPKAATKMAKSMDYSWKLICKRKQKK